MQEIIEGKAILKIPEIKKVSKKMPVFYNPAMSLNRDISILLLKSIKQKKLQIADLMAGTGIRTARFLLELSASKIKLLATNDANPKFKKSISKLLKQNKISTKKVVITSEDANKFLLNSAGFDYIEIDPFGSPNPYLDCAIKRLSRKGILAVTATDTSALAGSHENACKRKYWAKPLRNELMHEVGIRILARKVQLIGAQYEKTLIPIFSHSTEHYMRIYFACTKGKRQVDEIIKQHTFMMFCNNCRNSFISKQNKAKCQNCQQEMQYSGPIWAGQLWDAQLTQKMLKLSSGNVKQLIEIIAQESKINIVGFYSLSKLCHFLKRAVPKKTELIMQIKKINYEASPTHFAGDAIKTSIPINELLLLIENFEKL